jgi:hypothetical protein
VVVHEVEVAHIRYARMTWRSSMRPQPISSPRAVGSNQRRSTRRALSPVVNSVTSWPAAANPRASWSCPIN